MSRIGTRSLAALAVFAVTSVAALAAGDDYLIFEGKGAVGTVTTTAVGNTSCVAADNPSTNAVGAIAAVTTGKHKGELAYHGTYNGVPDPDPDGIGWGLVKKGPKTNTMLDRITSVSRDLQSSVAVLLAMDKNCDATDDATSGVTDAVSILGTLKSDVENLVNNTHFNDKMGQKVIADLQGLIGTLTELKADIAAIKSDKTTSFEELLKKLAPLKQKGKKVSKLLKDLVKTMVKAHLI